MISPDTIEMLSKARSGSLAHLAQNLGLPAHMRGTLADILNGRDEHVKDDTENRVRAALGLPPKPPSHTVPACASCGGVHTGDCHGQPVAAVVVLAPGQTVRRARKQPEKWVDYATAALRAALETRQALTAAAAPRYYDRQGRCYTDWREVGR